MAGPILIQAPSLGLNKLIPANMIADRESPLAQNVLFAGGLVKTPYGFAKLASAGLPLDGGNNVLGLANYKEKEGTDHIIAVTNEKVYEKDSVNSTWNDLSSTGGMAGDVKTPVSFAAVAHTDGIALDGTGSNAFYHLLVCDGNSPVQRWAGKFESKFYPLAGADGYHDTDTPVVTPHYARQVNVLANHVVLLNPKTWNATSELFEENPQTVLWGKAGLLEGDSVAVSSATRASNVVTATTSSAHNLTTGQTVLIAGTAAATDSFNGYFTVASTPDTTSFTYSQTGADETTTSAGTASQSAYDIMATGAGYNELVDTGDMNVWSMLLGNQMIIYQKHSIWSMSHVGGSDVFRFRSEMSDLGLLAPNLLVSSGNRHYFVGDDYNLYEYSGGSYKRRIGDQIRDALKNEIDFSRTQRSWMAIGANNSRLWIFYVPEGQEYITKAYGMDLKTGAWMLREYSHIWTSGGITSVAIIGAQSYMAGESYRQSIAAAVTYNEALTAATTYRDVLEELLTDESLVLGDSGGNVYQYDSDLTTDDGNNVPAFFATKIFDYALPDAEKWWNGITVVAKGSKLRISYRAGDFDDDDTGWVDMDPIDLTDDYEAYSRLDLGITSKQVQFKFANYAGSSYKIRSFKIHAPSVEAMT